MSRLSLPLVFYPLIAAFWLLMWVLLIRSELRPEETALRAVPVEHVAKLLFHDDQATDLSIRSGESVLGNLRLDPRVAGPDGGREMDFSGNLQISAANAGWNGAPVARRGNSPGDRRRVSWEGAIRLNPKLDLDSLRIRFAYHEPVGSADPERPSFELSILPALHRAHFAWQTPEGALDPQDYSLDRAGVQQLLDALGIDTTLLPMGGLPSLDTPRITARQSTVTLRGGEQVDAILVSVALNGQTMLEAYVSELGKVLQAKSILDWTLESD